MGLVPEWQRRSACVDVPTEVFFPEVDCGEASQHIYDKALTYCETCTVRLECLRAAMRNESGERCRYGVWGGMTPRQRVELSRSKPVGYEW